MPQRLQRSRQRGAHLPEGTICVDRSTRWGNPIRIVTEKSGRETWYRVTGSPSSDGAGPSYTVQETARHFATRFFEWDLLNGRFGASYPSLDEIRHHLAGRDLACFCPLPEPGQPDWCHGAVLLELAATEAP